jgi:hypothetical protein
LLFVYVRNICIPLEDTISSLIERLSSTHDSPWESEFALGPLIATWNENYTELILVECEEDNIYCKYWD